MRSKEGHSDVGPSMGPGREGVGLGARNNGGYQKYEGYQNNGGHGRVQGRGPHTGQGRGPGRGPPGRGRGLGSGRQSSTTPSGVYGPGR